MVNAISIRKAKGQRRLPAKPLYFLIFLGFCWAGRVAHFPFFRGQPFVIGTSEEFRRCVRRFRDGHDAGRYASSLFSGAAIRHRDVRGIPPLCPTFPGRS